MPDCNTSEENEVVNKARKYLATYEDMAELIRLGAYRKGSDSAVDEAMNFYPGIENFLAQTIEEQASLEICYQQLRDVLKLLGNNSEKTSDPMTTDSEQADPIASFSESSPSQSSEKNHFSENSETELEPVQSLNEQTLSPDTLSGLNSINDK